MSERRRVRTCFFASILALISVVFLRLQGRPQVHTSAPFRAALFSCLYFLSPSPTRSEKSMREEIKSIGKRTRKVFLMGVPRSLIIFHEHRHCVKFLPGTERGKVTQECLVQARLQVNPTDALGQQRLKALRLLTSSSKAMCCQLTFPQHR